MFSQNVCYLYFTFTAAKILFALLLQEVKEPTVHLSGTYCLRATTTWLYQEEFTLPLPDIVASPCLTISMDIWC